MNPLLDETSSSSSSFVRHRVHQYFLFNRARDRDRQTFVFNFEMKKRKKEKKKKKNWVPFLTPSTMRYISHLWIEMPPLFFVFPAGAMCVWGRSNFTILFLFTKRRSNLIETRLKRGWKENLLKQSRLTLNSRLCLRPAPCRHPASEMHNAVGTATATHKHKSCKIHFFPRFQRPDYTASFN